MGSAPAGRRIRLELHSSSPTRADPPPLADPLRRFFVLGSLNAVVRWGFPDRTIEFSILNSAGVAVRGNLV